MLKSLMLAVACAYINPHGLEPNAPVVQATVPEILKHARLGRSAPPSTAAQRAACQRSHLRSIEAIGIIEQFSGVNEQVWRLFF
jgi:hypothetical protein